MTKINSIPNIGIFARVCYNKENKEYKYGDLINFVSRVLYKQKHMSVFEHIWYHRIFDTTDAYKDFVEKLFHELYTDKKLKRFISLIYFDLENKLIAYNARTVLEIFETIQNNKIEKQYTNDLVITTLIHDPELLHMILVTYSELKPDSILKNLSLNNDKIKDAINNAYRNYLNNTDFTRLLKLQITDSYDLTDYFVIYGDYSKKVKINLVSKLTNNSDYDVYTFYIQNIPIYVRDHIVRHRFGVFTIKSLRYTKDICFMITKRTNNIKIHKETVKLSMMSYMEILNKFDKPEVARGILTFHTCTSFFWTIPKISLDNFIQLRTDKHAQYETRLVASAIKKLIYGN